MITDGLRHSAEYQANGNTILFVLFRVQVQHGAHQDGGCCVAGHGQVDQCFKPLVRTEADQAVLIRILSRVSDQVSLLVGDVGGESQDGPVKLGGTG